MDYKFKVEFLEPILEFLESLDEKSREKILYNIWKSRSLNDNELFKKNLTAKFGNSELYIRNNILDYLLFGTNLINKIQL